MFTGEAVVRWHMRGVRKVSSFQPPPQHKRASWVCRSTSSDVCVCVPVKACFKGFEVPVKAVQEVQVVNMTLLYRIHLWKRIRAPAPLWGTFQMV